MKNHEELVIFGQELEEKCPSSEMIVEQKFLDVHEKFISQQAELRSEFISAISDHKL